MSIWARVSLGCAFSTLLLVSACSPQQTFARQDDSASLVELARTYGQGSLVSRSVRDKHAAGSQTPAASDAEESEAAYKSLIAAYLAGKNYEALEQAAREARVNKTRFKGGIWKLYDLYDAVSNPTAAGDSTDGDWTSQIAMLKAWESARPESATAQIALAETYENYGDAARGKGYADTVSENGWKLYGERYALAASTLAEAARLKEKCPYWYQAMQGVARAQGWDKSQARKLFDAAAAFEPTYYHYYRLYANYLLPKWYGEPGESEAFAEEMYDKIGGQQGKFIYFEVASLIACQCDSDDSHMENLSWPKIEEGYVALGQLYGYSTLKMNRFAHMAVAAHDKTAAQQAFATLGNDWDRTVWKSSLDFVNARNWAEGQ